jgi:putative NADH-flavin reductase
VSEEGSAFILKNRGEHEVNIVILGATGFVGSALLNEGLRRGHKVTAIVRHPEKLASQEGLAFYS